MGLGTQIEVGDVVVVRFGPRTLLAEVLEDRGRLGAKGERILRIGWTPGDSEDRYEAEVPETAVVRAYPRQEAARALARIDEWSVRAPNMTRVPAAAASRIQDARMLVDTAVRAAEERGIPKDFELVHRRCVEDLGPSALHARRLWTELASIAAVSPTLNRLPTMIDEAGLSTEWLNSAEPLPTWHETLAEQVDLLRDVDFSNAQGGTTLIRVVGYCADMAAWIRMTYGVGE